MSARTFLIFALLGSLLFSPQVRRGAPAPVAARMSGCGMTACKSGCCAQMSCCAVSAQDQGRQEQAPATQRAPLDLAALRPRTFAILHMLPGRERRFVIREEAQRAHTLPRLAATCIQLI
jgi:hypothetical protein